MALSINGVCCERNFKEKFLVMVLIVFILMYGFHIGSYLDTLITTQVKKGEICEMSRRS